MFDRLEVLIGDKINILKNKTVMIIGLGGVGGNAFETIVRSGVENIIVVDNDIVDITNLNRQALAFNWSLSKEKVEVGEKAPDKQRLSPSVSLSYRLLRNENLRLRFSCKDAFRLPTFNDLYYDWHGTPSLRPEKAQQFNLGLTWSGQNFKPFRDNLNSKE